MPNVGSRRVSCFRSSRDLAPSTGTSGALGYLAGRSERRAPRVYDHEHEPVRPSLHAAPDTGVLPVAGSSGFEPSSEHSRTQSGNESLLQFGDR